MHRFAIALMETAIITLIPLAIAYLAERWEQQHNQKTSMDRTRETILSALETAILDKLNKRR